MLTNDFIKDLINNGGSLDKQYKQITEKSGFMVSKYGYEKTFQTEDIEEIKQAILQYNKILCKNEYIGIWKNNNIVYIDISKHYNDKKQALQVGKNNKQLAIYDLKNNCSIDILQTTYILYKYNSIKNDYIYLKEFYSIESLKKACNKLLNNTRSIYHYIFNNIEDVNNLLINKYTIIKDQCYYRDVADFIKE